MPLMKNRFALCCVIITGCFLCACGNKDGFTGGSFAGDTEEASFIEETVSGEEDAAEQWEKGYDLPIEEWEMDEAADNCSEMMETGYPIAASVAYSNMENYENVDSFLEDCRAGESGSVVIYKIHNDGVMGRMKFYYDGTDMYVVSSRSVWDKNGKPEMAYISHTRVKSWKYTDKGWFCYELCVPEPPEVTEIADGGCLIRVKPMTEEQRIMSERCVRDLGYQGQNLLCSN